MDNNVREKLVALRDKIEELRLDSVRTWDLAYGGAKPKCPCCHQSLPEGEKDVQQAIEEHRKNTERTDSLKVALFQEAMKDPDLKDYICTHTICFYSKDESHYTIDKQIQKAFPCSVCDSESCQGWAYASEDTAKKIAEFIQKWCQKEVDVYPTDPISWCVCRF